MREDTHVDDFVSLRHETTVVMIVMMDFVANRERGAATARPLTCRTSMDSAASLKCNLALTSPRPRWARCA
jgi:hypothetical protein